MKIVIAPDSYKESLSALEVATAIEQGFREIWPDADYLKLPLADGGEGTVEAMVEATAGGFSASPSARRAPPSAGHAVVRRPSTGKGGREEKSLVWERGAPKRARPFARLSDREARQGPMPRPQRALSPHPMDARGPHV